METEDADVETSSEDYQSRFSGAVGGWFLDVQTRAVLDLMSPWPSGRVLDLGGGHGQLASPLASSGREVTVFGSPRSSTDRIRQLLEEHRIRYECGDLLSLPYADRSFDCVLAFRLLAHLGNWQKFLSEAARVARGAVIFDYPSSRSLNRVSGAFFSLKKGVEGNTRSFRVFHDSEVATALGTVGLRATGTVRQFFFPMALHRACGVLPLSRCAEAVSGSLGLTRLFGSPLILRAERIG